MTDDGFLTDLREIQTLVCTHLHQMFISDPNLVRLVHFQVPNIFNTYLAHISHIQVFRRIVKEHVTCSLTLLCLIQEHVWSAVLIKLLFCSISHLSYVVHFLLRRFESRGCRAEENEI